MLVDKLYLSAYLFVIASLAVIATTTWMVNRDEEGRAARLNRRFFFGLSAAYALVLALLFGTGI